MKKTINKRSDGSIRDKYYKNDRGQKNGLFISYWYNGDIWRKRNYVNGELYGLDTDYENGKIETHTYHL